MFPFALRSILENFQKTVALAEEQERQRQFASDGFEIFELPIKKWKMYTEPRVLEELDFIVTHVTAVKGGFGVSKKSVDRWEKLLRGMGPGEVGSTGMPVIDLQLTKAGVWSPVYRAEEKSVVRHYEMDAPIRELAHRLALWERYRGGVPYHQIGAANGDNVANRELRHVTWHGSLGNFGVGWALDVSGSQDLDNWHIETGRASLTRLYQRIIAVSPRARAKGVKLGPHRCFSPYRFYDTNPKVHREIVLPCVRALPGLEVDYNMRKGKGRPVPVTWDPDALYDAKGRRLR